MAANCACQPCLPLAVPSAIQSAVELSSVVRSALQQSRASSQLYSAFCRTLKSGWGSQIVKSGVARERMHEFSMFIFQSSFRNRLYVLFNFLISGFIFFIFYFFVLCHRRLCIL